MPPVSSRSRLRDRRFQVTCGRAKPRANDCRHQATSSHMPPRSVRPDGTPGHAQRHPATRVTRLTSEGSLVRTQLRPPRSQAFEVIPPSAEALMGAQSEGHGFGSGRYRGSSSWLSSLAPDGGSAGELPWSRPSFRRARDRLNSWPCADDVSHRQVALMDRSGLSVRIGSRDHSEQRRGQAAAEPLTEAEANTLTAPSRRSMTGKRNRALVTILYRGGLRIAEALALKPSDVDPDRGTSGSCAARAPSPARSVWSPALWPDPAVEMRGRRPGSAAACCSAPSPATAPPSPSAVSTCR